MTVGDLFLLLVLYIIIVLSVSQFLYKREIKLLEKKGFKYPKSETSYDYWLLISFIVSIVGFAIYCMLYLVIINWNVPI